MSTAMDTKLRLAAFVEATTLLVMVFALVGRTALGGPDLSATIGPLHGLAFLTYVALVLVAREDHGWSVLRTLGLIAAAVIPFGGYVAGHRLVSPPNR